MLNDRYLLIDQLHNPTRRHLVDYYLILFRRLFPHRWRPELRCNSLRTKNEAEALRCALFNHNAATQSDSHSLQRWATRTVTAAARRTRQAATRVRYRHTRGLTHSRGHNTSGHQPPDPKCCRCTYRANNDHGSGPPKMGPCCIQLEP